MVALNKLTPDDFYLNHSLHPAFLEYSLNQSLKNLNLETLDVMYIQNPETI